MAKKASKAAKKKAPVAKRKTAKTAPKKAKAAPKKAKAAPKKAATPKKAKAAKVAPKKAKALRKPIKAAPKQAPPTRAKALKPIAVDAVAKKPVGDDAKAITAMLTSGSALLAEKRYDEALAEFVNVLLLDDEQIYALYGNAHCLVGLAENEKGPAREELIDGVLDMCERLIARTSEESLGAFIKDHAFPRETLRFAYNAIAWHGMERAESQKQLEKALEKITHGLTLVSPIDDKAALLGFWDTKVRILLKLGRKEEAFEIVARTPKDPLFADLVETKTFTDWFAAGGADELLKRKPKESVFQALTRLSAVIAKHGHETYAALIFSEPVAASDIAAAEKKLKAKFPPSYIRFVTEHGCFKLLWDAPTGKAKAVAAKFDTFRGCRALLSPAEIASETLATRKAYARTDDKETATMLAGSLLFQENFYRDNFYAFRVSDAPRGGEMSVHSFYHDDAFVWSDEPVQFDEHVKSWVQSVIDDR